MPGSAPASRQDWAWARVMSHFSSGPEVAGGTAATLLQRLAALTISCFGLLAHSFNDQVIKQNLLCICRLGTSSPLRSNTHTHTHQPLPKSHYLYSHLRAQSWGLEEGCVREYSCSQPCLLVRVPRKLWACPTYTWCQAPVP